MYSKANKFLRIIVMAIVIIFLQTTTACGKKKDQENLPVEANQPDSAKKTDTLFVWVENLRARQAPGKDAKILTELTAGTVLISLGETTGFKDKVILRGKTYEAAWVKVKLPDGRIAWVFEGAVTRDKNAIPAPADSLAVKP